MLYVGERITENRDFHFDTCLSATTHLLQLVHAHPSGDQELLKAVRAFWDRMLKRATEDESFLCEAINEIAAQQAELMSHTEENQEATEW